MTEAAQIPETWREMIAGLSEQERADLLAVSRGTLARGETPEGYEAFYELIFGHPPPRHVMEEYIAAIFESVAEGGDWNSLLFASRLFWKTTTVTVTWGAWQIGLHPERANMIIAVNDDKAAEMAGAIADIIEHHPGWKTAFPHVTPDKDKGWGEKAYEVKCTGKMGAYTRELDAGDIVETWKRQSYDEWRSANSARKDATLRGRGYRSGDIIGAHPDGFLVIDDIHDEGNTESPKEVARVVKRVQDTIMPIRVNDPVTGKRTKLVMIGTPWTKDDAYHAMKETGRFVFRSVPVMRQTEPQGQGAVFIEYKKLKGWYRLTWPERFDEERVRLEYDLSKYRGFMRMYMLTIIAVSDAGVKFVSFPHDRIDPENKVVTGGVDYASVAEPTIREVRTRSFFAYFWAAHLPQGGIVIIDGVFDQLTRLQSETHLVKVQNAYPMYRQTDFELDGKGEEAYVAIMQRHPTLRITGVRTGNKNKFKRFENEVQPDFEDGSIMISDEDTPALNALRESLENFPYGNMDVIDACYYVRSSAIDALAKVKSAASKERERGQERYKRPNPFRVNTNVSRPGSKMRSFKYG